LDTEGPLKPGEKLVAGFSFAALLIFAVAAITLPVLVAVLGVAKLWPAQLDLTGWPAAILVSIMVAVWTFVIDIVLGRVLRRYRIETMAGDFARRLWIFLFTWIAIQISLEIVPGVTSYGLFPALLLAGISSITDLVTETVSARNRQKPGQG
jgi:hypothetical protein